MVAGAVQVAKRAFVKVLLALAAAYDAVINVNRDSTDDILLQGYRKVVLKVHPHKGGSTQEMQQLQAAREEWDAACHKARGNQAKGRPKTGAESHGSGTDSSPRR